MSVTALYLYLIAIWCMNCIQTCDHSNDQCVDTDSNHLELKRITTTRVGEIQEITLQSHKYQLKTISIEPLAFEISNYLTHNECDEIIKVSQTIGLQSSVTRRDHERFSPQYQLLDLDNDDELNLNEMRITMERNHNVNLNDEDIIKMYETLNIAQNKQHKLSTKELFQYNPSILNKYIDTLLISNPGKRIRMSEQAWLHNPEEYTPLITNIHHRLYDLFEIYSIPQYIVNNSYTLQVVHYSKNGKYNAHYDSAFRELGQNTPCCFILSKDDLQKRKYKDCKSCRYMTILYYLNDVENGGYTVFPLTNKYYKDKRFNEAATLRNEDIVDGNMEKYESFKWRMNKDNLPEVYCGENVDNVKVKPEKGKALIWFNHLIGESKWKGDQDFYAMHTGCPVIDGEKWIANHWILVNDVPFVQC